MSDQQPAPQSPPATNALEIPLADIDKLLEGEDPGFTKSLEEIRAVEVDKSVEIEATVIDDGLPTEEPVSVPPPKGLRRIRHWIADKIHLAKVRASARLAQLGRDTLIFLKTRPKEFALYLVVLAKAFGKAALVPLRAFGAADRFGKLLALTLIGLVVASAWILLANFKGVWLPSLTEPILRSLEQGADSVEKFDPKEEGESFYSAFPQERYEFLFGKIKVNLKRTPDSPNPMGAFELTVLLDSKDTGIEVRDREVEFFDSIQRTIEEETFSDLDTKMGKERLKSRLKGELNKKLTQGWVKDVNFKTFIIKP